MPRRVAHRAAPEFDGESFSSTLDMVRTVVEMLCFEGAEGWGERTELEPERPRDSLRAPIIIGDDRATLSLYGPLENLEHMLDKFLGGVHHWATKSKYFKEVTRPFIIRTIENSISEASTAEEIREALELFGPIDTTYVNSFERFSRSMEEPILELRALGEFIASILKEGNEISPPGSGHDNPPMKSGTSRSSSHFSKILNPVIEASGSRRSVETKSASTPTSSPYFSTILNPEPATHASTSGHVDAENTVCQRTGFEDLLEAAGYDDSLNKKSPSPEHEPERESKTNLQYPGLPSYSPPASPSASVNTLVKQFSVPWIKADEPSADTSSSILLQPSALYQTKLSSAPPGTSDWKIELSERKGHPIHILNVGSRELDLFAKCLTLVHTATQKGEECVRVIIAMQRLSTEMETEYKQWNEFCIDLERNVSIDEMEAREKMKDDPAAYAKSDDDGTPKPKSTEGKGKAKDPSLYGPTTATAHEADAYETNDDWFGAGGDPRDYGLIGPGDDDAWGYRKFDAPLFEPKPDRRRRRRRPAASSSSVNDPYAHRDDDGSEDETTVHMGSPMSMDGSDGTDGVEVVTSFEEAFAGEEDEGEDQVMLDEGEDEGKGSGDGNGNGGGGEGVQEEGTAGKKGFKSGGKLIGLYGEEL